ncbi:hypothetical protein AB0K14_10275 [Actinosynnema sp. NPDC050801]|uniref:hypothetical protein n=1 Tax=unclassified Actinosynnema TaxID=2637065 RepID=UPI0033D18982
MSELLWVPIPGGLAGDQAVVQVLVVPRLASGTVADFGLRDWPATLASASFEMRTKTSEGIRAVEVPITYREVADSAVWHAFFDGDAGFVHEFTPRSHPPPRVDDTFGQAGHVAATYRASAKDVAVAGTDDTDAVVRPHLATWFDETPVPAEPEPPPVPVHVARDFHGTVSLLREHPAVLRKLGLVFEVVLDRSALAVGDPAGRLLSIRCPDPPLSFLVTAPWTHYLLTDDRFVPAPSGDAATDIRAGLLDLDQASRVTDDADRPRPRWAVTTVDVDGAVGRLRDAAKTAVSDGAAALPPIRSAGIAVVRPGRAQDFTRLTETASRNSALESLSDAEFHAEDLVLGYRVDVRAGDDERWHPLCARQAGYRVNGLVIAERDQVEEGHVKANAAVRVADGSLRADEIVTRWDGWSLVVPRPDLLSATGGAARKPGVALPFDFTWEHRLAPGSLPPLRFSRSYNLRVRIADLAGGGLSVDQHSPSSTATDTVVYRRHEPLPPPVVHVTGPLAVGATVDRLVIRGDHDRTVAQVSADDPTYPTTDRRGLVPAEAGFTLVEQHGEFDPPVTAEQSWQWARRALAAFESGGGLPDPAVAGVAARLRAEPGGVAEPIVERSAWHPAWPDPVAKSVELVERGPDRPITLHWDGDRLVVGLAKGEHVTVALSSTLRDQYVAHFEMQDWLTQPGVPPQSLVEAQKGGHPLLSPPRVLRLVHAVRRPLVEPRWRLARDAVVREEGDTTAVLHPKFGEGDLNTDSTLEVAVAARWTEKSDTGEEVVQVEHLHTEPVERGAPRFEPLRHSFGDTKHRRVVYTLTAVSRFRDCFHDSEPDSAFRVAKAQPPVVIPSSARPPAPVVLSVGPAFRWSAPQVSQFRVERVREGGWLRVELARPWFVTGEGEALGVLVAAGAESPFVTRIGRDPAFASPAPPAFPDPAWFPGKEADRVLHPEAQQHVHVVPHGVSLAGDRWLADVRIAPPVSSYYPFVQLVLARYQRESLRGLALSTAVVADPVRLPPDRRLVVSRTDTGMLVELTGTAPDPPNLFEVVLEHLVAPPGTDPGTVELTGLPDAPDDVPAWFPVDDFMATGVVNETVDLPEPPDDRGPLRLRVREVEFAATDSPPGVPLELLERSVFVDVVRIPDDWV